MLRTGYGNKEGKGMLRAGYGSKKKINSTPFFDKFWNTKILSECTQI